MFGVLSFFLGVCAGWYMAVPVAWCVLIACGCVFLYWFFSFSCVLRLLWLFVLGVCYCGFRLSLLLGSALPAGYHDVSGVVVGLPAVYSGRTVFSFAVSGGGLLRLSWYGDAAAVSPGQVWDLSVKLRHMRGSRNDGGRDYAGYMLRSGYVGVGYVRSSALVGSVWNVDRVRSYVASVFGSAGLLRALGVGDRSLMTSLHREVLAGTGTSHLMAISGLHVGMVAGLFGLLARLLWYLVPSVRVPAPRCALLVGVVFAFMYSLLAGFTLPTQRALLMLCFYAGSLWCGRNTAWSVLLLRAFVCVLLFDPLAPAAADFWLSFGAVAVIIFVLSARTYESAGTVWSRVAAFFFGRNWLVMQFAVCVGTLPLLLYWFGNYSLVSFPANLVAIPVVSFLVLPLVLLTVLLSFAPSAAAVPLHYAGVFLDWLWSYLSFLSALPFASLSLPQPPWWSLLLCAFGVFLLLLPRGLVPRIAGVACVCALFIPASDDVFLDVVMLDVGQGSATVVLTESHTVVVDTGAAVAGGWSAARSVIVPYLHSRGRRSIDLLVLSHGDNDHSGGAADLLRLLPVSRVLAGADVPGFAACVRGDEWSWDGVDFSLMHPPDGSWSGNDGSCVLRVAAAGRVAIVPGDIERRGEAELLSSASDLRADVLLVPHHGSRTSSGFAFIAAVRPLYALVSAGCGNRFAFPKQDIMDRYRALGAVMLSTAREGTVQIRIAPDGGITHSTWRRRGHRIWHDWGCASG